METNTCANTEAAEFKLDTGAQTIFTKEKLYRLLKPRLKLHPAKVKITGDRRTDISVNGDCRSNTKEQGITKLSY